MSIYAHIVDGIVEQVIVADSSFVETLEGTYVETDDRGTIRKNPAAIGDTYDAQRDAFIKPQPYPSWTLNEQTCRWEPPTPKPVEVGPWAWDEASLTWVKDNK